MQRLAPQIRGLSQEELQRRLQRGDRNAHVLRATRSYWQIVRANVFSLYNIVLFAAFLALFVIRGPGSAVFPAGVVLINVVLGLVQELRAKWALDKLTALPVRILRVRRDGETAIIPVEDIVKEDVLELQPGDAVPVDGPVLAAANLQIDEAQLTGESEYVLKQPGDLLTSGSFCISGAGLMRAEKIGAASYVNHLSNVARAYKNVHSPLEQSLDALVKTLVPLTLILAPLTLLAGNVRGLPLGDSFENVVNLISSLVPQGLIVFVSISFAYGVIRISRFNALIQRQNAVEMTGEIRYLCADKTGTLTRNRLSVKQLMPVEGASREEVQRKLADYLSGASTQNRTVEAITGLLGPRADSPAQAISEVPFSSERKWSSVTLASGQTLILGAPEIVLGDTPLKKRAAELASGGMRVVAFAESASARPGDEAALPTERKALAIITMQDELRPNISDTLAQFAEQGIEVKIISGDAADTVRAVAQQAGMKDLSLVTEQDLEDMDDGQLEQAALRTTLFARIKPPTKRQIIAALERHGPVAMIGDGVNDVPALKQASLAIAMNDGTQIAKDVAEVILLNNDFSTLPRALFEGRELTQRLYGIAKINLVKVLYLTLLFILIGYSGLAWPLNLLQTTWLSLITLTMPAMLIIFRVLPIPRANNTAREVIRYIVLWGLVAAAALIAVDIICLLFWKDSVAVARTVVLGLAGLFNSLVLWDIYAVNPAVPRSFRAQTGAAVAGLALGLISALAPAYAIPTQLGLAPLGVRELALMVFSLGLSYVVIRYFARRVDGRPAMKPRPRG